MYTVQVAMKEEESTAMEPHVALQTSYTTGLITSTLHTQLIISQTP